MSDWLDIKKFKTNHSFHEKWCIISCESASTLRIKYKFVSDFLDTLDQYFAKYGKTLIIHDGPMSKLIGTIDGKFLEFILSSTKFIDKADNYLFFHSWLGTGLLTSTGKHIFFHYNTFKLQILF